MTGGKGLGGDVIRRRSAKVIVVDPSGNVLLFRGMDPDRPGDGTWWFPPGGGVEADESDEQAALREFREETGLEVERVGSPIATRRATFAFEGQLLDSDEVYFLVRVDRFEVDDAGWRPRTDFGQLHPRGASAWGSSEASARQGSLSTSTPRLKGVERHTYTVKAQVVQAKIEDDSDVHLVIASRTHRTRTMIVEFPKPTCVASSFKRARMAAARTSMLTNCGSLSTSSFTKLKGNVTIKGVGFWDELHGQTGVAPNGIELHPVLKFSGTCSKA